MVADEIEEEVWGLRKAASFWTEGEVSVDGDAGDKEPDKEDSTSSITWQRSAKAYSWEWMSISLK